jgi:hypothetical protein
MNNSCKWDVYKCVLCTVYYIVMFTCTLVRSHPEGRRSWGETWTTVINSYKQHHRVGRGNKMHARQKGPEPRSVYIQKGAMKDVLARCLKKTDVQVCTLISVYILFCSCRYSRSCYICTFFWPTIVVPLRVQVCDCINNRCLFFCRLKINHDTHKFILDSGTVANTY